MKNKDQSVQAQSPLPSLNEQQQYWDERWGKTRLPSGYSVRRGKVILSFLKSLEMSQPKILDIGCGTGWFASELARLGCTTGIDLSEAAIEAAKSNYPGIDFLAGDLYEHEFPAAGFDIIVAQEVIPHVEDQREFVKIVSSLLRPGGRLVISMVNKTAMDRADWDHGPSSHIINWLTLKDLRRLLGPKFRMLETTTIIPIGNKGILRLVNSHKLNSILNLIIPKTAIQSAKERMGLGYSRIAYFEKQE